MDLFREPLEESPAYHVRGGARHVVALPGNQRIRSRSRAVAAGRSDHAHWSSARLRAEHALVQKDDVPALGSCRGQRGHEIIEVGGVAADVLALQAGREPVALEDDQVLDSALQRLHPHGEVGQAAPAVVGGPRPLVFGVCSLGGDPGHVQVPKVPPGQLVVLRPLGPLRALVQQVDAVILVQWALQAPGHEAPGVQQALQVLPVDGRGREADGLALRVVAAVFLAGIQRVCPRGGVVEVIVQAALILVSPTAST
mmetsp:Transcript_87273/g.243529  ORF Transcript_87273/g.243529 Transcript_87273/m.243529 type:complete len:255 (+) Transcript_87273:282-1046(+)